MSTVIIAEKPSMARAIREGLGSAASRYEITNAFGHILEQAGPDEYLPGDVPKTAKGKKMWRMQDLPIIPDRWVKYPKKDAKEQLGKIGALLKSADTVINAGDPDREGQLLIDEKNSSMVSRIIRDALEAGLIRCHDETVGSRARKYLPIWA